MSYNENDLIVRDYDRTPSQDWMDEQLRRAFQDQLLYGSSAYRVASNVIPNEDGNGVHYNIERVDPRSSSFNGLHLNNIMTEEAGSFPDTIHPGLGSQLQASSRVGYNSTLTEQDIRDFMNSMTTTTAAHITPEYYAITGREGYFNLANMMQREAGNISFNTAEVDKFGHDIVFEKSSDYKVFKLTVIKDSVHITISSKNGTKREYDLLMKNAKRGVYLNMKKTKWIYESK